MKNDSDICVIGNGAIGKASALALARKEGEAKLATLQKGDADAALKLGDIFMNGRGVPKNAIEAKQQAEQDAQRMQFVLQKETQEAERKRIEAQGVSDFQRIVSQGISQQLLEWKGIEATEKLVASPNSKIVVIGNPKNGLPLIFPGQ